MTEPTAPIETNPPTQSPNANCFKPRITIQYCTQCKWMLRAAYFAQELLSTFNTDIGEIALIPRTGGIFTVTIFPSISANPSTTSDSQSNYESESHFSKEGTILWDRKRDGGFPEVKELKSRVRNVIDPGRDLGHTDRALKKGSTASHSTPATAATGTGTGAKPTPVDLSTSSPGPSSVLDPASIAARAEDGRSETGTSTGPRTEAAGGAAKEAGTEKTVEYAPTSASGTASLSARAKIVDETAGGTERKSNREVCEDCN